MTGEAVFCPSCRTMWYAPAELAGEAETFRHGGTPVVECEPCWKVPV